MNYVINVKARTIKTTTNAADGQTTFGHFQVAKASLIAELEDSISVVKDAITSIRKVREKDLKQNGNGQGGNVSFQTGGQPA